MVFQAALWRWDRGQYVGVRDIVAVDHLAGRL
jgi:hypothetical protein